jgi:cytidylate kinase
MKADCTIIAIDGPSASGKSSVSKQIANVLGYHHADTGSMYRIFTWKVLQEGISPTDSAAVITLMKRVRYQCDFEETPDGLCRLRNRIDDIDPGNAIRTPEVEKHVSAVAAIPEVRDWLVQKQRDLAKLGDLVIEGRDIGTVVFPETEFKFYFDASPEVRARRRAADQKALGSQVQVKNVGDAMTERDRQDSTRSVAPLKVADDAIRIDTSDHTVQDTADVVLKYIRSKHASKR